MNPNSASELHQLLVTMSPNKQARPDVVFGFVLAEIVFGKRGSTVYFVGRCTVRYKHEQGD